MLVTLQIYIINIGIYIVSSLFIRFEYYFSIKGKVGSKLSTSEREAQLSIKIISFLFCPTEIFFIFVAPPVIGRQPKYISYGEIYQSLHRFRFSPDFRAGGTQRVINRFLKSTAGSIWIH